MSTLLTFPQPGSGLVVQLTRVGYVPELDELRYTDSTGAYDAVLNPGGYGGPNPARASLALFLSAELVRADASPGPQVAGQPGDPLARTDLALRPGADGVVRLGLHALRVRAAAELVALAVNVATLDGDVYYSLPLGAPVVFRNGTFQPATPADYATASVVATFDEALTPRAQQLIARLFDAAAGLYYDGISDGYDNPGDQHLLRLFAAAKSLLGAANICWQRSQPYQFQLRMDRLAAVGADAAALLS